MAVRSDIWRACAGSSVKIPTVDSRVYYFPQGHSEYSISSPSLVLSHPFILCRVISVNFLANSQTDQVYAKIKLIPIPPSRGPHVLAPTPPLSDEVLAFAKVLTASDANNGGGFSVPRFCADSIFPPLNFDDDPPVQNITVTDVHGTAWEFRHIYRGTPRRHLLTTGWSTFVNYKKLVAGDSVVFMKNRPTGELFVGIRRGVRPNVNFSSGRWSFSTVVDGGDERKGFSRNDEGRVLASEVVEAAELAAQGKEFEVVYYPRAGLGEFVVKAEMVEESMRVYWTAGTRVKMATETDDASRMTWFHGTVTSAKVPDIGPWRGSPWRMLQVTWDEPDDLQNVKRVSPWQVECVVPTSPLHSQFPPTKKFRALPNTSLLPDGEGELFPFSGLSNSMMGPHLNPSLISCNSFPAGMQGVRQVQICSSNLSDFATQNSFQICTEKPTLKAVSTELNIGSSHSDKLSPHSPSSVHFFGNEIVGNRGFNSQTKAGINSFQLFGKIIHIKEQPLEGGCDDVGSTENNDSKVYNESEDVNNPLDLSLTYTCTKLCDRLDVQCQRA